MPDQPKRAFHTATDLEIKAGDVSDVYFSRTIQILKAKGLRQRVKAEIRLKSFPQPDWKFGVLAGPVFSDRRYNQYYYAVDPVFAAPGRPAYNPGGGYAGTQLLAALSKRFPAFWIGGFARWDTLNRAVFVESPLVRSRQYLAGGVAVAWILGESKTRVEAPR